MPGQFAQGGVTMRDCSTNRAGFDRVLMAVAATFLAVSATSALAQATGPRDSAAELAIDAAVPRPEPANVPPPTVSDFKMDTTAATPDATKAAQRPSDRTPKAADRQARRDRHRTREAEPAAATQRHRDHDRHATPRPPSAAKEPVKAASNVPPADQPVADKLREMLGAKSLRYFDRKNERAAVEKFYTARDYAPLWTQGGELTDSGQGRRSRA